MSDASDKKLVIPVHITQDFIEHVLQRSEDDSSLRVVEFSVDHGCKPGDHFCSLMLKVTVSYETANGDLVSGRSLVVKTNAYDGDVQASLLSGISLFTPEIRMYSETLPAMERLMKTSGMQEIFWPKALHCSENPPVIVLEDIRPEGYSMIHNGVCFEDLQVVVEKIALFHALSLVVHEEDPKLSDYTNDMITEKNRDMLKTLMRGMQTLIRQTSEWEGFEKIHAKLKKNQDKLLNNVFSAYRRERGWGYNVLNHGDFHIRNMMFQTSSGDKVRDVKFLDYQISHWGSPALDLCYLIYINGDRNVADRREEVYLRYYELFAENLIQFGYSKAIPSLLDLKLEILHCGAVEVIHALSFLPLFMLDVETVKFNEVYDSTTNHMIDVTLPIYEEPNVIEMMKKYLLDFMNRGYLD